MIVEDFGFNVIVLIIMLPRLDMNLNPSLFVEPVIVCLPTPLWVHKSKLKISKDLRDQFVNLAQRNLFLLVTIPLLLPRLELPQNKRDYTHIFANTSTRTSAKLYHRFLHS